MANEEILEKVSERIFLWFGIDVSKKTFAAAFHDGITGKTVNQPEESFDVSPSGVKQFLKWRKTVLKSVSGEMGIPDGVVMETTGHYSTKLAQLMHKADSDLRISICNALKISHYIRSHKSDKSDRQDAEFIASFGQDAQPEIWTHDAPEVKKLREMVKQRLEYTDMSTRLKNRADSLESKEIQAENKKMIEILEKRVEELDKMIKKASQATEEMKKEIELMVTVPGVALLSAATIYAELGSLKEYTRSQLSASSGLCPTNLQSGVSLHSSHLSRKGSALLRRILYLDSCQGMARIPALKELQERLLARAESSKMTARCACMRKLLMILRGIVISGKPYDKDYKSPSLELGEKKLGKNAKSA